MYNIRLSYATLNAEPQIIDSKRASEINANLRITALHISNISEPLTTIAAGYIETSDY